MWCALTGFEIRSLYEVKSFLRSKPEKILMPPYTGIISLYLCSRCLTFFTMPPPFPRPPETSLKVPRWNAHPVPDAWL